MSDQFELLHAWKIKSELDLKACRQLLQAEDPLAEIIAFHAQQAVEKALKGFLISRKCCDVRAGRWQRRSLLGRMGGCALPQSS